MGVWALKGYSGLFGAVLGNTPDNSDLWQAFFFLMGNIISCHCLWKIGQGSIAAAGLNIFSLATQLKIKRGTWLAKGDLQITANRYNECCFSNGPAENKSSL